MERVPPEHLEYTPDGDYLYHGIPFTGFTVRRYADGSLESEVEYRDGMLWGVSKVWLPCGQLVDEEEYRWGLLHGRRREWHDNGNLAADETYELGIRLRGKQWDEESQLTESVVLEEGTSDHRMLLRLRSVYQDAEQREQHRSNAQDEE